MNGDALLVELTRQLNSLGRGTGRTHLHKIPFLAKDTLGEAIPFVFVIHHYGPYSFEIDHTIQSLTALGVLEASFPVDGYGAKYAVGPLADRVQFKASRTETATLTDLVTTFGPMGVKELERLSTALFLLRKGIPQSAVPTVLRRVKPHIDQGDATRALPQLRDLGFAI